MCGIAGIIYKDGHHNVGQDMTRMLQSMKHRGPDSTGYALYAEPTENVVMRYTTANTACDVYPVLYFARDAFGIVPLKGKSSMTPMVVNPKPTSGDPLGQRGTVGWKLWTATVILQEAFMARLEVGATA